jgi:uncharacterized protein
VEISASKYVSLTTFRKDGRAVATPVWQVTDGSTMMIVSDAAAGKVKRIRNNPRVTVAPCDIRGRIPEGAEAVDGNARVLDEQETLKARELLARRYVTSRVGNWFARVLHIKRSPLVGIAITF